MAVTIYLGKEANRTRLTLELKARKSLDGNIMIFDHQEMDIVIMPKKSKVVTFAKNDFSDTVYESQSRLFDFLKRKGIVTYESIRGGNVYGSLEAQIAQPESEDINTIDYTIYGVYNFIKEEKPYYDYIDDYVEDYFAGTALASSGDIALTGSVFGAYQNANSFTGSFLNDTGYIVLTEVSESLNFDSTIILNLYSY